MLITAFRSERTKAENEKDFRVLPGVLRSFFKSTSLCAYWLVGHWTECKGALKGTKIDQCVAEGEEIVDALEYSWLFVKTDESVSGDAWLRAGMDLANLTDQFAFVIRLNGEVSVRYANGEIKDRLTTDASVEKLGSTWLSCVPEVQSTDTTSCVRFENEAASSRLSSTKRHPQRRLPTISKVRASHSSRTSSLRCRTATLRSWFSLEKASTIVLRVSSYRGIVLQVAPYGNQTHKYPLGRMKRIEIACAASTSTIFALARSDGTVSAATMSS